MPSDPTTDGHASQDSPDAQPDQGIDLANRLSLTPAETAVVLGVSPRKIWELSNAGELPHVRFGRAVRYPVDGLRRWLDQNTSGQPAGLKDPRKSPLPA